MAYIKDTQKVVSYPRIIMENYLGRNLLSEEEVHHIDGNPLNNNIDNLEVLTKSEHLKIHASENRKYYDKTMICPVCGKEFLWTSEQQQRFNSNRTRKERVNKNTTFPFCSKSCAGLYGRQIQKELGIKTRKGSIPDETIRYIRNNYIPGDKEFGGGALATRLNINRKRMYDIVNYKTYKDIV